MQDTDSPLRISRPLASDTPQIYPVTVVATEVGNKYNINGELQPILILEEGVTYRFDQSDTTNKGHPLRLSANIKREVYRNCKQSMKDMHISIYQPWFLTTVQQI